MLFISDPCLDNGQCVTGTCLTGDNGSFRCACGREYEGTLCDTSKYFQNQTCTWCINVTCL